MSERLARAPARETAALQWLAEHDPEDGHGLVGEQASDPGSMFTQPVVLAAFYAGANCADDEFAIERAEGQRQLDDAHALMAESAALFMGYAQHHWHRADEATHDPAAQLASLHKARVNLLAALRLKEWMAGLDRYTVPAPGEDTMVAHAQPNVRPVTGPLAEPGAADAMLAALAGDARALSVVGGEFHLKTGDPRFDPTRPVVINGYRYTPAKEA